tara:strand:+ start:380 stop:826 length:447 start_codon:yes stop_codon:yes gene_type:complete
MSKAKIQPQPALKNGAVNPNAGLIVTPNTNPAYGTIRVDQIVITMENGFMNRNNRSAFIGGRIEDLNAMGFAAGQELPGKIVRKEFVVPQYEGHVPAMYPVGHAAAGTQALKNGNPYFLEFEYTDNPKKMDSIIATQEAETVDTEEGM